MTNFVTQCVWSDRINEADARTCERSHYALYWHVHAVVQTPIMAQVRNRIAPLLEQGGPRDD